MGASFRSGWGDSASRRRTAHEQGPSACGVFWNGGSPKRDSQGIDPLSGCGQSPPCRQCRLPVPLARSRRLSAPRTGTCRLRRFRNAVCMNRCALSVLPARLPTVPDGQSAPRSTLPLDTPKIRRANSEALLPRRGKQRRSRTPAAYPCPPGQGCVIPPNLPFRIGGLFPAQPRRRERQKKAQTSPFQKGRKSSSALAPSTPSNSNRSAPRPRGCGHRAPVRRISLY